MENEEIMQLHDLKEKLLRKVIYLRDRLKDQEKNGHQDTINLNITLPSKDKDKKPEFPSTKYKAKLCEITGQVTGIVFKDVDRKWLHDDIYMYTAKVITKTISFNVELTVACKDLNDFLIEDIVCHFIDVPDCYMLEVSPWFQKITRMKNFSLLMSTFSNYNENNILRSKILRNLELKKYSSIEQCTDEDGGILVHMHSPLDTEKNYVIFYWTMKFLDLMWRIEHFFTVKSTDIDGSFRRDSDHRKMRFSKPRCVPAAIFLLSVAIV
ncbi:uncharacterized protein LOC105831095 isoform X2 [Monomorium pharaonis]|uniref:uncharacterized protein LOC105831095 isoform X2 n=1 Tax=Monomorium pharaonis TaxID=307658 RepID=UPI0017478779|nr:uncharacterized protein LOC105831095 isoform X2 [Monomorium pharaonis]